DVLLKRDLSLRDFLQGSHGGNRFADGAGLEESFSGHRFLRFNIFKSVAFGPVHFEIVDYGHTDTRNLVARHAFLNTPSGSAFDLHAWKKAAFHSLDSRFDQGCLPGWCKSYARLSEQ